MESASVPVTPQPAPPVVSVGDKGLKSNAIGFVDALVIGLASTAPAYSLAAVVGLLVVEGGVQAPAMILVSFLPMFFIAAAFFYMNRADPDCGTTFSWVTRTLGPYAGWIGGWAVCTTGILVIGSLADVAARYLFVTLDFIGLGFGADAADSKAAVMILAVAFIIAMTLLCILGTELSARFQRVLIFGQVLGLLLFAVVALVKVATGDAASGAVDPALSWFSPFEIDSFNVLVAGLLIGVFIYWGWESAVNLSEEAEAGASGKAGVVSTAVLLLTYLAVGTAVVAYAGPEFVTEFADDEGILGDMATSVFGSELLAGLVTLAIFTSALASTQTTILPASRTTLSMARARAYPELLGRVHPRFYTPHVSTAVVGLLAIAWYVPVNILSENFLFDTLTALAIMIAFYYSMSGVACLVHYRREIFKSVRNFLFVGVAPAVGAVTLGYLFFKAIVQYADKDESYGGSEVLGIGLPTAIGAAFLLGGVVLLILWRLFGDHEEFFRRRGLEAVDPEIAAGRVKLAEDTRGMGA